MQPMEGAEMRIVGKLIFVGLRVLESKGDTVQFRPRRVIVAGVGRRR